jgi:hypothetical protein
LWCVHFLRMRLIKIYRIRGERFIESKKKVSKNHYQSS